MNIDERLEALLGRHEALTQSVELMLLQQREDATRLARHEDEMTALRHDFNRAFDFAVRESRNERQKRREGLAELDTKITQLASAQLVTEGKLQSLASNIDKLVEGLLHKGGNGKS